jgi:hypothetical protein
MHLLLLHEIFESKKHLYPGSKPLKLFALKKFDKKKEVHCVVKLNVDLFKLMRRLSFHLYNLLKSLVLLMNIGKMQN